MLKIKVIPSPTPAFIRMLLDRVRPGEREDLGQAKWGAVGLAQGPLIDLYWAADVVEKVSQVKPVLVQGNCPQHVQMLAFLGRQAEVDAAAAALRRVRD